MATQSVHDRFWSKVIKTDTCWNWTAAIFQTRGYGQFQMDGTPRRAHRVSYEWANGPIPAGLCVLHRCDNRRCVRPDHLFLGTHGDNNRDMFAKQRENKAHGEQHYRSRLTEADVRAIRASADSSRVVGLRYGINDSVIRMIRRRVRWQHVRDEGVTA